MVYRAALIGCGNIGSANADDPKIKGIYSHAGAYDAIQSTKLVAVCDVDITKAQVCASRWSVEEKYTDPEKLFTEARPEIVSICTPNQTHAEILEQALNTNSVKAVLMEKPLALDYQYARKLVDLAKKKDVVLSVNYIRRYSKGIREIVNQISGGSIGSIQKISGNYTKGIFHNGTHWLDLVRWIGGPIESVTGNSLKNEVKGDGQIDAFLQFKSGATASLQSLDADKFSLFEMDIIGTLGRIRLVDSGHKAEVLKVVDSPYYSGYRTLQRDYEQTVDLENTILHAVENLVECVETKATPWCSGNDGLESLKLAAALMLSAKERRPVELAKAFA